MWMIADEMRKLTEETNQRYASDKLAEVAAAKDKAVVDAKAMKLWWFAEGIPKLLVEVRCAARRGLPFYEEVIDECPDYVVKSFKAKGFEVSRATALRGLRDIGDNTWERYNAHVLLIRWGK
jgi:hypothetical protein